MMLKLATFFLSGGTGAAFVVAAEAAVTLQAAPAAISPETPMLAIQIGLLVSAGGMLIFAGRIIGQWQAAQQQLITAVATVDKSNIELRSRVSRLEGIVHLMEKRDGRPGLWAGNHEEESA